MAPIGRPAPVAALDAYWSHSGGHDQATIDRLEGLASLRTTPLFAPISIAAAPRMD